MKIKRINDSTGLKTVRDVWHVWGTTLPVAWHEIYGMIVVLSPADCEGKVLVAYGPQKHALLEIDSLVQVENGTWIQIRDGREGWIRNFKFENSFMMIETADGGEELVQAADIVFAEESEEMEPCVRTT